MEFAETYKDRTNSFWITFKRNRVTLTSAEMTAFTKIEIKHNGVYYNSVDHPSGFERDNANARVKVLPNVLGLEISRDNVEVIVYDSGDNVAGLFWGRFELLIRGDVTTTTAAPTTTP